MGVEGKVAWDPRSSAATHTLQLIGSYLYSSLSLSHVVSSPLCAAQPPKHWVRYLQLCICLGPSLCTELNDSSGALLCLGMSCCYGLGWSIVQCVCYGFSPFIRILLIVAWFQLCDFLEWWDWLSKGHLYNSCLGLHRHWPWLHLQMISYISGICSPWTFWNWALNILL